MRVLVKFDEELKTKAVLEIVFATYDDNINNKNEKGLLLYASNRMVFAIKKIPKKECDNICNQLYLYELADLTKYKAVEFLTESKLKVHS